jgi:hypothetical protein
MAYFVHYYSSTVKHLGRDGDDEYTERQGCQRLENLIPVLSGRSLFDLDMEVEDKFCISRKY